MASFRKEPSGKWRTEVSVGNLRRSKSFPTKFEAQQWAYEEEIRLKGGGAIIPGKTLADALERYVDEVSSKKKGERWERVRAKSISNMNIGQMPLENINVQVINRWIDNREKSVQGSTVNRELNFISGVFEYSINTLNWASTNPIKKAKKPKNPAPRDRRISEQEIAKVLLSLDNYQPGQPPISLRHEIAIAFLVAIETAMRRGEIWSVEWKSVFLNQSYLRLKDTKNGTPRDVPLSDKAVELLKLMAHFGTQGKVFKSNKESSGSIFRAAIKLTGIKDLTFHDTRHEALTRLARKVDVLDLARMVGHRDPRSLMIYYNATASEIAERLNA